MKKRPFVLIEILIAFALVTICIVPLVEQPLKLYRSEMKHLEGMELERLADWTFTEVKEMLLKNEIPWEKIPKKGFTSSAFPLPAGTIQVPGYSQKRVQRSFTLTTKGEKMGMKNEVYRQLGVEISLNNQVYKFRFPIQKLCMEE